MQPMQPAGLPARAALEPTGLYVALREIGPEQLQDPFMQETIVRVPARQEWVQIPKSELGKAPPNSSPAGLIFHVARCGSTLASQLLKQHEQVVVYSEPLPINEILVPPHKWNRAELVGALRTLGTLFARHAGKPYILKFSSWNTLYCDLIVEAFPSTPWALCIRDPIEVCVSLLQQRPGWLRESGSSSNPFADIVDPTRSSHTQEDYVARLYAAFCRAAGRLDAERGELLCYEALPDAVWNILAPHFRLSNVDQMKHRMTAASQIYSKSPVGKTIEFAPDIAKKRAAASHDLRQAVETFACPELERLTERFRDRQMPPKTR